MVERVLPRESPAADRAAPALGWSLQAGTPAGPAKSGERPPCDGTLSRTDRWPADARTRSHCHQPRVNLSFYLSSLGAKGLLASPAALSQIPARTPAQTRRQRRQRNQVPPPDQ